LRDAGMEVIYTGLHQTPEMIATAAIQEDVDVIGLSILSGAHMTLIPRVQELVQAQGRDDILITGGGIIPKEDVEALEARGIGRLFGPGTPTTELIAYIKEWCERREKQRAYCQTGCASSPTSSGHLRPGSSRRAEPSASRNFTLRENCR